MSCHTLWEIVPVIIIGVSWMQVWGMGSQHASGADWRQWNRLKPRADIRARGQRHECRRQHRWAWRQRHEPCWYHRNANDARSWLKVVVVLVQIHGREVRRAVRGRYRTVSRTWNDWAKIIIVVVRRVGGDVGGITSGVQVVRHRVRVKRV